MLGSKDFNASTIPVRPILVHYQLPDFQYRLPDCKLSTYIGTGANLLEQYKPTGMAHLAKDYTYSELLKLSFFLGGKEGKMCMLSNQRSRWSDYLDDINDEEEIGDETLKGDSYSYSYSLTPGAKEEIATEHLVEDEVHPDFI